MKTIELKADFKPLKRAIYKALSLAQSPHLAIKLRCSVFRLFSQTIDKGDCFSNRLCSINSYATRGTGESWLIFNPSKRLNELMATLRTANCKRGIVRKRRFGHCLAP
jgi:hypothetical protein